MENNKKKILIIDDDKNLLTVLVDKLNTSGFDVISAGDGEEGLQMALDLHPDLILLDVIMPKMGGWEMLEKLRKDNWGKNAKVVMLTVLEDPSNVAKAIEEGSTEYLIKTDWSLDDIVSEIKLKLEE